MPFQYSLQPLLRLRLSLERQEEQRLFALAAIVARLRHKLETVRHNHMEQKRFAMENLLDNLNGATLHFIASCDDANEVLEKALHVEVQEAEKQRLRQLLVYQQARQKREILEDMREQYKAAYDLQVAHHEQQMADEAFLLRLHVDSGSET